MSPDCNPVLLLTPTALMVQFSLTGSQHYPLLLFLFLSSPFIFSLIPRENAQRLAISKSYIYETTETSLN